MSDAFVSFFTPLFVSLITCLLAFLFVIYTCWSLLLFFPDSFNFVYPRVLRFNHNFCGVHIKKMARVWIVSSVWYYRCQFVMILDSKCLFAGAQWRQWTTQVLSYNVIIKYFMDSRDFFLVTIYAVNFALAWYPWLYSEKNETKRLLGFCCMYFT